ACAAAGALGDRAAAGALAAVALGDGPAAERAAALDALARLRPPPEDLPALLGPRVLHAEPEVVRAALRALWVAGDARAGEWWREALHGSPPDERARATALLAGGGIDPRDLEALSEGLSSPAAPVRTAAALGLGLRAGAEAAARVRGLLEDPEEGPRIAAALALGVAGSPGSVADLAATLMPGRPAARAAALRALARLGAPAAAVAFRALLADPSHEVRAAAATGLGARGEPADAARLGALAAEDPETEVRVAASLALGRLGGTPAVEALRAAQAAARGLEERVAVLAALAASGDPTARAAGAAAAAEASLPPGAAADLYRTLGCREEARRAYEEAVASARTPSEAERALRGLAEEAAAAGDLAGAEAALARLAGLAPLDLPSLAAGTGGEDALATLLATDAGFRARAAKLVRPGRGDSSVLDRYKGPAVVRLSNGQTLKGTLEGWIGASLALRAYGGRVLLRRGEIRSVDLGPKG
ncbi:MAG: HEAT repeat domain-containing protein, partial [Planctomycetales bacterium]|nr:HEAT repeat domain-containing protein [Planctomycetales bacterium]